jgi:DUF2075 family protein
MIVYRATKDRFVNDVLNNTIANEINSAFVQYLGRRTSPNEEAAWRNSMMYINNVINNESIPDKADIAIEYQIPLTSKRIDFIISGADSNNIDNAVVIELKQWQSANRTDKPGIVQTRFQHGLNDVVHPSYQAWSYVSTLQNFNETIREKNIILTPCAFLHNYEPDNVITDPFYQEYIDKAPVFLKYDGKELCSFISSKIKKPSKEAVIDYIETGKLRPSKQLADALESMLKGNKEFLLLDEQKNIYETAINLAIKAHINPNKKQVLIVEGGPGTGKSVLAINLLVELIGKRMVAKYVTKNSAPREVYATKLAGTFTNAYITSTFSGSGSFIDTINNTFDALIVDEAHRLNLKSGLFQNKGENQIQEIINAAKMSVFFVDDNQRIHIKDIGTKKAIEKCAIQCDADVHIMKLESQFRCNGSDGYLCWIDNTLQIQETANIFLTRDNYDFRVFDNPTELFNNIANKNRINNKSRVVAGYCWKWVSKNNQQAYDIEFPEYGFSKKWNLNNANQPWLIGDNSIEEIGCIHTCQGLELDYVGVIIGPDIRYENGKIVTDVLHRASSDNSVRGIKGMLCNKETHHEALQIADEIIKNTYRTLMTRGMKGCYVYCCDKALSEYFKRMLKVPVIEDVNETIIEETSYRIESRVNDETKYIDFLPVYSIKAACGYFGNGEMVEELGWMKVEGVSRLNRNMFIVQAAGHSMEPKIKDGNWCVFRTNVTGSREGKIVLVQHHSYYDADNGGSYSIKQYTSKKSYDENGNWMHEQIILKPLNQNYSPIYIEEENADSFTVIGEFVTVL